MMTSAQSRLTGRELAYYFFLASIMLFAVLAIISVIWFALPRGTYITLGELSAFPPSAEPYIVRHEGQQLFYVVNTGDELIIFDWRVTTSSGGLTCRVNWITDEGRFEDPCWGSKFTLTGAHFDGPPRLMRQYAYKIEGGQVLVNPAQVMPMP
jgi:cytochrome b6-f complex iron-sulfur subunit